MARSKGEQFIHDWLKKHAVKFEEQKKFHGLSIKMQLPFDFFVPAKNLLIEYNGRQHYEPVAFGGDQEKAERDFEKRRKADYMKKRYARTKGLKLLVIPHQKQLDSIAEFLESGLACDIAAVR
jgi:hypothetical protein